MRPGTKPDVPAVAQLLTEFSLPTAGVREWLESFWLAFHEEKLIGVAGIERYGIDALLRSVVVASDWRRSGLGRSLVGRALEAASSAGVRSVFLLTTTAEKYFPRLGFEVVSRGEVP
ncbi:MAG: GNAT family N-acetyltransferase, partial [Gemmatimonadota bacterium]